MKIYISGPITGTEGYMEIFARAEEKLHAEGYIVVNPARINAQLPKHATSHEEYMRVSLVLLEMCDAVLMLKGWRESRGCRMELEYACEHGITITFEGGKDGKVETGKGKGI